MDLKRSMSPDLFAVSGVQSCPGSALPSSSRPGCTGTESTPGPDANLPARPRANADSALIRAIQGGLPLVEQPFAAIAADLGWTEEAVIEGIRALMAQGAIKRLGVVVRHQELGYGANAMVVWDLPDAQVDALGQRIGALPFVTLCYRRPRRLPEWPYNLFTMIHGRDRAAVLSQVAQLKVDLETELGPLVNAVLFSGQRFKQRGAFYRTATATADADLSARVDLGPGCQPDPTGRGEAVGEGRGKDLTTLDRPRLQSKPPFQTQSQSQFMPDSKPDSKPKPLVQSQFQSQSKVKSQTRPKPKVKLLGIVRPNTLNTMEPLPGPKPSPNPQIPAVTFPARSMNLGRELPA